MVARIAFVAYALRAGSAVNFFSETVLVGFKCGLALYLASTQLPKLFGWAAGTGDFWENMGHFLAGPGPHEPDVAHAGADWRRCPAARQDDAEASAGRPVRPHRQHRGRRRAASRRARRRVARRGAAGLPMPALPARRVGRTSTRSCRWRFACFLLAAVDVAIGRMNAAKRGYRLDATREFLAIGGADLVAGLGAGFP